MRRVAVIAVVISTSLLTGAAAGAQSQVKPSLAAAEKASLRLVRGIEPTLTFGGGTLDYHRCKGTRDPQLYRCRWHTTHRFAEVTGTTEVRFLRSRVEVWIVKRVCEPIGLSALCE